MMTYRTPGVYTEEIAGLPPSVVGLPTAIPAFLGYTEKNGADDELRYVPTRISTLLEYEQLFGGPQLVSFTVETDDTSITEFAKNSDLKCILYYQLHMYFKNGGGPCYIVSVGSYTDTADKDHFETGLTALEKKEEPTLILLTDAVNLAPTDYYSLCQAALAQCNKVDNRFAIFDIPENEDAVKAFREGIGMNYLKYGAAYYPQLETSLSYRYDEAHVQITHPHPDAAPTPYHHDLGGDNGLTIRYVGTNEAPKIDLVRAANPGVRISEPASGEKIVLQIRALGRNGRSAAEILNDWDAFSDDKKGFDIEVKGDGSDTIEYTDGNEIDMTRDEDGSTDTTLSAIKDDKSALYHSIKSILDKQHLSLPPSAMMAGIYAKNDNERGVWKAPANVSVAGVSGPLLSITNQQQETLNVDPDGGKSVNVIRSFPGKGSLVWGARTLAGNDNEWRYVPVRRLFNTVEASIKKATAFAVFEPNDVVTWLKVQSMIESYLTGLWKQGAMAGATEKEAFYVAVGLGKTMTEQDVLEGRMIVEIGIAAVRPAEFIVLRFSHKLQEA